VFAARDAEVALGAWASSEWRGRADAHAVYRAALDREERAASVLAAAVMGGPLSGEKRRLSNGSRRARSLARA
jgi:hypothetical protein